MTIKELEIFDEVSRCQNLTQLSKKIGMTQPNISITIKSLETKFNEKLFDRIGKKLVLNERGRTLHKQIVPILHSLKDIKNLFDNNK